jgi:hypothetical protein
VLVDTDATTCASTMTASTGPSSLGRRAASTATKSPTGSSACTPYRRLDMVYGLSFGAYRGRISDA